MSPQVKSRPTIWWGWKWVLLGLFGGLLLWGVSQLGLARQFLAGGVPDHQLAQAGEAKKPAAGPIHPLIQALLEALDAFHGEGADAKDALRNRLQEADQQLQPLLNGRKEKILQANRKLVLPVIEEPSSPRPPAAKKRSAAPPAEPQAPDSDSAEKAPAREKPSAPARKPPTEPLSKTTPPAGKPASPTPDRDEVQTALIRSLLGVLDKINDVSEEDKQQVRKLLLEADQDLAKALKPRSLNLPRPPVATPTPPAKP